jgi:hypothetical protein
MNNQKENYDFTEFEESFKGGMPPSAWAETLESIHSKFTECMCYILLTDEENQRSIELNTTDLDNLYFLMLLIKQFKNLTAKE